uniref:SOCS box domain-containing protein n=1 Tax=Anopheles epiroticus TaxID=199890 RepID=A0A182PGF9_9DIPT
MRMNFPLHRAAACKSVAECSQLLADGVNPYQPTQKGWTALHAAIANRAERVVDLLLDRYEEDWTIAQQTIKHQFLWKTEQVEWKTRPILIAWTEEECEATVAFATSCPAGIPLSSQVFVLLRNPNHGHRFIALDVCNRSKWIDIMRLIRRLVSNGVLSLDRSDLKQHDALNYLQLACILSTKEIIVKLIGRGASLAVVSGSRGQNPFMAAGEAMRQDVIDLLMSKYSDRCKHLSFVETLYRQHGPRVKELFEAKVLEMEVPPAYDSMFRLLLERNEQEQLAYVNPAGYNLLHIGCKNGLHGDALERLIEHGMDVNGPAPDGQLPLSLAACCGTVKFLLAHGAHIELLNGELLAASLNHMHYCAAHRIILRVAQLPWFRECAHMYLPWMVTNRDISERNQDFLEEHPHIRRFLFDCLYEHSKEQMAQLFARAAHNGMLRIVLWILDYRYDIDYDYTHCDRSTPLLGLLDYHRYVHVYR